MIRNAQTCCEMKNWSCVVKTSAWLDWMIWKENFLTTFTMKNMSFYRNLVWIRRFTEYRSENEGTTLTDCRSTSQQKMPLDRIQSSVAGSIDQQSAPTRPSVHKLVEMYEQKLTNCSDASPFSHNSLKELRTVSAVGLHLCCVLSLSFWNVNPLSV